LLKRLARPLRRTESPIENFGRRVKPTVRGIGGIMLPVQQKVRREMPALNRVQQTRAETSRTLIAARVPPSLDRGVV
jgi:hypothetical protein